MHIVKIGLTNWRNLQRSFEIELPASGLLLAMAPNTTGKTNFLESIAVLLRGKSWRARLNECVRWGEEYFLLKAELVKDQAAELQRLAVRYYVPSRKMRVEEDGQPASIVSFYVQFPFIMFVAEDSFLLSQGPAGRRNFINQVLVGQPQYLAALVQYHRALKQRNMALKRAQKFIEIENWTDLLCDNAVVLWQYRENLTNFINAQINGLYCNLSGEKNQFTIQLVRGAKDPSAYKEELCRIFPYEQRYKHSLLGPHRDDWLASVGGRPAASVLSRGQLRSLVITLKVLAHRYIKQMTKENPLLLFDDALNELDASRQLALLANLPATQTILTCTELPAALKKNDNVFMLDLGTVRESVLRRRVSGENKLLPRSEPHFTVAAMPSQETPAAVLERMSS